MSGQQASAAANAFVERLARPQADRAGRPRAAWLSALRRRALDWVSERGFPTAQDEAWKYTRVAPILAIPFVRAAPNENPGLSSADIDRLADDLGGARLVFVNGRYAAALSSPHKLAAGTTLRSLAEVLAEQGDALEALLGRVFEGQPDAFTALNAGLAEDGAFIRIPAGTTIEAPVHLVFVSAPGAGPIASHPRSFVLAGAASRATIVETHAAAAAGVYFTNAVTEVVLDEGAALEHYKVQNETPAAFHVALLDARQGRGSRFSAHSVALGAALARHAARARLEAPDGATALDGLYVASGTQHLDNPTTIEHVAPRCTSRALYKGVVDDRGRGVFDGRIIVHAGAMKTDASQTNRNLLLSRSARADTRPRLEILADDVKCAHGAAVGQLDEQALFYLRSRGLEQQAARGLLTCAFASEMVERIRVDPLRNRVRQMVAARLPGAQQAGLQ